MAIELRQQLKISQQLVMTPQLQQAIKLLQLSQLELADVVQQELEQNPLLEETVEVDEDLPREVAAESESPETTLGEAPQEVPENREATDAEKIADIDWQSYAEAYPHTGFQGEGREDDDRRSFEATATRRETLSEHMLWQLQLIPLEDEERIASDWIVGNLDEHGYLRSELDEISRRGGISLEVVERALAKVQALDPTGVAARDLRECLLLQLDALEGADPLARSLVADHMESLQRRDFRGISRSLGISIEEVAAAARVVGELEPRPGRPFGGEEPVYIVPDIYVHKIGDEFHVVLNEDGLPKLKINQLYRDVLSGAPAADAVGKETKEYVRDKVRAALWLIKSIHQRQRTIYKVMQSIIKHQGEFFELGVQHLKPLNLRDVAEDIGMHESTVSRVTTNKYCHTPQGIFELKYFFNSSISRVQGDAIASESVKDKIRRVVTAEDPRRPLSDQRIAEMLRTDNIDIARRTVTKYRESMNILSSTKRRRVG